MRFLVSVSLIVTSRATSVLVLCFTMRFVVILLVGLESLGCFCFVLQLRTWDPVSPSSS